MTVDIIRGNALDLPIDSGSVDLIVTSPPYFGLRSYQDGGEHYDGQIGAEATPTEFVDALIAATAEMVRVLKPSGSIWVNLGDKYVNGAASGGDKGNVNAAKYDDHVSIPGRIPAGFRAKSLMGIPWRYALRCIDDLGLILRAEVVWSKPNGLPESVTDRVRRSHETWFHFTVQPRYFSAVDEIREPHLTASDPRWLRATSPSNPDRNDGGVAMWRDGKEPNPLGKLPGSVWTIPTEPLQVPDHLGVDHFAAFPTEWPRRIIQGWSPAGVCVECGEGRRPVVTRFMDDTPTRTRQVTSDGRLQGLDARIRHGREGSTLDANKSYSLTGYACACPEPTADTTPGVVLDPFGGTGTTALVAHVLGRHGISVDLSGDYCRLAEWRTTDPGQIAKAMRVPKPVLPPDDQMTLL